MGNLGRTYLNYPITSPQMKIFLHILFISLVVILSPKKSFASDPDTTKNKYAADDPRNPDCPCHQYQKLAEDEYKRLLEKQKQDSLQKSGVVLQNNPLDSATATQNANTTVNTSKNSRHTKSARHKLSKELRKSKLLRVRKTSGKKWKKGHLIDCGRF